MILILIFAEALALYGLIGKILYHVMLLLSNTDHIDNALSVTLKSHRACTNIMSGMQLALSWHQRQAAKHLDSESNLLAGEDFQLLSELLHMAEPSLASDSEQLLPLNTRTAVSAAGSFLFCLASECLCCLACTRFDRCLGFVTMSFWAKPI